MNLYIFHSIKEQHKIESVRIYLVITKRSSTVFVICLFENKLRHTKNKTKNKSQTLRLERHWWYTKHFKMLTLLWYGCKIKHLHRNICERIGIPYHTKTVLSICYSQKLNWFCAPTFIKRRSLNCFSFSSHSLIAQFTTRLYKSNFIEIKNKK